MSEPNPSTQRSGRWKLIAGASVVLILAVSVWLYGAQIRDGVGAFLSWVDGLGAWAPLVFVAGYALATVALVPGSLLTLAGGVLFGLVKGTAYVFVAASIGSGMAFLIARYLAREGLESKLESRKKFQVIDRTIGNDGLKVVFLLRLVPFFPFVWLNYGLGLTRVRLRDYLLGGFGMLPGTFLYVFYGDAIGSLAALGSGARPEAGGERWLLLGVGLVAAIVVTTWITRQARQALELETRDAQALVAREDLT
ncbi:MAG: TVP38/TMEM64 family protein [Thermoanaerobaculia bacterium]|nr:TVP38/TMEM64 family protein [Thermoanaerobaculia bacterium]